MHGKWSELATIFIIWMFSVQLPSLLNYDIILLTHVSFVSVIESAFRGFAIFSSLLSHFDI
ncbi:hypothetical protein L873DRAFT_738543 [Choiromyces venosus 120613-1]|uniref:Uncharacterized protein n=1 Tax=Choiromyces venosus 120613-1 TaxID=1336337 RepID=A0A3N4IXN2_9PEZI|nr:hypothetical protein L873DRAFT_738543 [Choiromyces venosus 120613-1]